MNPRAALFGIVAVAACRGDHDSKAKGHDPVVAMDHGGHDMAMDEASPAVADQLTLSTTTPLAAGTPTDLVLELTDPRGQRVSKLDLTHTKPMHLIVVSDDLSYFAHLHPDPEADGRLRLPGFTLPHPGHYILFADHKPAGAPVNVARAALDVPGLAQAATPLTVQSLPATGTFDGFTVTLAPSAPLVVDASVVLRYQISDGSGPVTDFEDFLGARGHCVGIHEGADQYLHSHPLAAGAAGTVDFHTSFPAAGTYRIWAEFRPRGQRLLSTFTVQVAAAAPHGP